MARDLLLDPKRCSIHACDGPPAVMLYGEGIYAGGFSVCGPHGVKYEALGYAFSYEAYLEKKATREQQRREPYQLHLGEPGDPNLKSRWRIL